ncbi:MAG: DUF3857 domain-containing protein [Lentisphaeria bacterium]
MRTSIFKPFAILFFWVACTVFSVETGFLNHQELLQQAAAIDWSKYPNADDAILDDEIHTRYEKEGTSVSLDDTAVKILTKKGARDNRQLSVRYHLGYTKAEFLLVQKISPTGKITLINVGENAREVTDNSSNASNIYDPRNKILVISIPELEKNDILRYVIRRETVHPRVPDTFSDYQVFEYTTPIIRSSYLVNAPAALPLKSIALKSPVKNTVIFEKTEQENRILYSWKIKNVPLALAEPKMPDMYSVVQRLLISTVPTWDDLSQWYWKLCLPHLKTNQAMAEKVAALIKDKKTDDDKIRAIFHFVSQKIRYMGVTLETEAPGYEPHDVTITFSREHGVCRDKAALLTAMLRSAGFQAFPVLINVGNLMDKEVPVPYFNHAITAILKKDGTYQLLDSTDENTKEYFPSYLCNMSYLVARPDGESLQTTNIIPYTNNLAKISTQAELTAEGKLTGTSRIYLEGINDNAYRGFLAKSSQIRKKEFFSKIIKRVIPGVQLDRLEIAPAQLRDTSQPLEILLGYSAENILVKTPQNSMFQIPEMGHMIGIINFILQGFSLEKRRFPLDLELACGIQETIKIACTGNWGKILALPNYKTTDNEFMISKKEIAYKTGNLSFEKTFALKKIRIEPNEYLKVKDILKKEETERRQRILIANNPIEKAVSKETTSLEAYSYDYQYILNDVRYVLKDEHTWEKHIKVQKQILTYKGVKDNAEITIAYNPVTTSLQILSAQVINGEQIRTVQDNEKNLMDASWCSRAPRYPLSKKLVISFPQVQINSIIEYELILSYRDQPYFYTLTSLQKRVPVQKLFLSVQWPDDIKMNQLFMDHGKKSTAAIEDYHASILNKMKYDFFTSSPDLEYYKKDTTQKDGNHLVTITCKEPPILSDEEASPANWEFGKSILFQSGSWPEYCKKLYTLLEMRAQEPYEKINYIVQTIQNMSTGDPLDNIKDYLERNLYRVPMSFYSLPLTSLTMAEKTLEDGYGHSADTAILYYAILKELNYKPEFVMVSNDPPNAIQKELYSNNPDYRDFDQLLVRVKTKNGWYWFNQLNSYAKLGTTPHENCFFIALPGHKIKQLEIEKNYQNNTEEWWQIQMENGHSAKIAVRKEYFGSDYASMKKFYKELTPEKREQEFATLYTSLSLTAQAIGKLKTDFDVYPGILEFTARIPDFAVINGNLCYMKLPSFLPNMINLSRKNRENPYALNNRLQTTIHVIFRTSSDFSALNFLPKEFSWESPAKQNSIEQHIIPGKFPGEKRLQISVKMLPENIAPENYDTLLDLENKLTHPRYRTIILQHE